MTIERYLRVSNNELADFHEALAWMVQVFDRDFGAAKLVSVHIGEALDADGVVCWAASVQGVLLTDG